MLPLSKAALAFLDTYQTKFPEFEQSATEAKKSVQEALADSIVPLHAIIGRPKSIDSLRGKLRRKKYSNPRRQVTDLIGVRVITYFWEDVDRIETELRNCLEINATKSRDARKELEINKFGYRSIHLIARLRPSDTSKREYLNLGRRWFEIQIRSILDHAWSEIEHEVIYKSGVNYPIEVRRRFTAVAGALEVLEHAFADLAVERNALIEQYKLEYCAHTSDEESFDVARLLAFLEVEFPTGKSWRKAEQDGEPFPRGMAVVAVEALKAARLHNATKLRPVVKSASFRRALRKFAVFEGIEPNTVSHLAVLAISLLIVQPKILKQQFPEMVATPSLSSIASNSF